MNASMLKGEIGALLGMQPLQAIAFWRALAGRQSNQQPEAPTPSDLSAKTPVKISGADSRFNGKYLLTGVTSHRRGWLCGPLRLRARGGSRRSLIPTEVGIMASREARGRPATVPCPSPDRARTCPYGAAGRTIVDNKPVSGPFRSSRSNRTSADNIADMKRQLRRQTCRACVRLVEINPEIRQRRQAVPLT